MRLTSLLAASSMAVGAMGAALTKVTYPNNATSKVEMYIYVPDKVVEKPPLVVVIHSCKSTAESYIRNNKIPWKQGSDKKGYITGMQLARDLITFPLSDPSGAHLCVSRYPCFP